MMTAEKKEPVQLEFAGLLTEPAPKGDPTSYICAAQSRQTHYQNELAAHDHDLERWRIELLELQKEDAPPAKIIALKAQIRGAKRARWRVCRLLEDQEAIVRRYRQERS